MVSSVSVDVFWSYWQIWIGPVIVASSAGLVILLGRALRRSRGGPPVCDGEPAPPDPFEVGSATERRTAHRRKGRHARVYVSDADAQARPFEAWIIDRSGSGICLSVPRAIPLETVLSVRACNAPD